MASFMGRDVWWAVPAAVVLGVPMYTNAAGILPIVEALIGKGAALGTTLAFIMTWFDNLEQLVAGTSIGFVESFAQARGIAHLSAWARRVGGLLVALVGGYLVWTA